MSRIEAQVQEFLRDERDKKYFMNLYRNIKTVAFLKQLRHSELLTKAQYEDELRETISLFQQIKNELSSKKYDVAWFCDLWSISAEYQECESLARTTKDDPDKFAKVCARISNKIPEIFQVMMQAKISREIYQPLQIFCRQLQQFRRFKTKIRPSTEIVLNRILQIKNQFNSTYQNLSDPLRHDDIQDLNNNLIKFRTEFGLNYY